MTVIKKKKGTLVAVGPLQTFPEVKQVDTISSTHRQLPGRESLEVGPTAMCLSC